MMNLRVINWVLLAPILLMTMPSVAAESKHIFDITGNERTQTSYIVELSEKCMSEHNELAFDVEQQLQSLNQCLLNARLFSDVKSSFNGNRIKIVVEEKWTLIPAPFYSSSGETRKAGIILFETNLLGLGLTLAAGATTSNRGDSYFGFFTNPSVLGSPFFASLSANQGSSTFDLREDDKITDSFLEKTSGGSISIGYHFPWLNLSGQLGRTEHSFRNHKDFVVPDGYATNLLGATIEYDKRDYKLYFSEGFYAKARYAEALQKDEEANKLKQSGLLVSWQHQIVSDHAIYFQSNTGRTVGGRVADAERVGSSKGFRGIETKTAWAESYQTETIEYQVPIHSYDKGTLTWAAFVDQGHIQNRGGLYSDVNYTAPGVGLYFYLKRLALPGLGLEYGINKEYQGSFFNFSVGLSI